MPDFVATHRISHEACRKMLDAGIAKANELGCKVSLAVVDEGGTLIAFLRMDGARFFSGRATIKKAITSASQRLPSGYFPKEGEVSMQIRMDGDFTNIAGGFPVLFEGQVVGAVAAGGAKIEQDVEIAKAALAALGLKTP
ncbi:MAG: GlcG/HbpS family heme-binding protein [Stellaceae bacterium]